MPYDIDPYTVATSGMDEAQCHYSLQSAKDPLDVGMCGLQTPPRCNQKTVRELQHKLLKFVSTELREGGRKIPMAWHNAYTDCGDLDGCGLPGAPPPATNVRTTSGRKHGSNATSDWVIGAVILRCGVCFVRCRGCQTRSSR
eukprot:COSAG01_NODE_3289_length_6308_cov_4.032533_4_plen_142_part_00